jgi:uncharacterized membrane protein YhaH (DUF805 family)
MFYLVLLLFDGLTKGLSPPLILQLASLAVSIWALVELGFLRGTSGPNQHGPDPLVG